MTSSPAFAYASRMLRKIGFLILALGVMNAFASAQKGDKAENSGPVALGPTLTAEELEGAVRSDEFSMPTPGELLAAVDKLGKPDWAAAIRPPGNYAFSSRPQMALNIGGLIADGFLAVEAEDSQQVKNIGKDIIILAKPLGVQQEILNRGKSLTDFAERGQWDTLKEEFEATQNEVKTAMTENKDSDLITLVTLGGWIRAMEAMSDYVNKHYTADGARLLRQPAVAQFLREQLKALPEKVREDATVRKAKVGLTKLETAVSFPTGSAPTKDAVKDIAEVSHELLKDISQKTKK